MKVEIFTKDGCSYCIRAKNLLTSKGMPFTEHKFGTVGATRSDIEAKAGKPINTLPQVFIDNKYIGGYTELAAYYLSN
jgi:glutaredoxin 1